MRKTLVVALLAAAVLAAPGPARAGPCGLPDAQTLWLDFGDPAADFAHTVFRRPGLIIATSKPWYAAQLRAAGTHAIFWDMHLAKRVGTPSAPADPAVIEARAHSLFAFAAAATDCATPLIALNELNGAQLRTPWSATNAQYRANVLAFVRALAARGARPFLLVARRPAPGRANRAWWLQVAQSADIVREVYPGAPYIASLGQLRGAKHLIALLRRGARDFVRMGVPPRRVGLMLGFHTTPGLGGRHRLQPARAWFEVVKLQALAARHVADAMGLASVWSWGWGVWSQWEADPDKGSAACVYLWARDPALCDGLAAAGPGFNPLRLDELWLSVVCTVPRDVPVPC